MGFFNGSTSVARFYLETTMTDKEILKAIFKEKISPLDSDTDKDQSYGWCSPFTGDPEIGFEDSFQTNGYLCFGFRVDTKKIPGTTLRLQYRNAIEQIQGEDKKVGNKLKRAIKERIKSELMKKAVPSTSIHTILFDPLTGNFLTEVTSKSTLDLLNRHVDNTLSSRLIPLKPGTMGLSLNSPNLEESMKPRFDMTPVSFGGAQ